MTARPLRLRRGRAEDHDAFRRLFPELGVDDPVPSAETWRAALAPATWIAERDDRVLAYAYVQEYDDSAYVRHLVVSPEVRREGVGRWLMQAVAERLRNHGKASWRLNVRRSNEAAIALYQELGLRAVYVARVLRLPWSGLAMLPLGSAEVCEMSAERIGEAELRFELPRGQLAVARRIGRLLFEASAGSARELVGLSVFDPKVPGAFPFRVREVDVAAPLLKAMRQHVPANDHVHLVAENDERLSDLLCRAGATMRDETLHFEGSLLVGG